MFKYLEIYKVSNNEVSKRIDVTTKTDRMIDRLIIGIQINMNQDEFSIRVFESEKQLEKI